LVKENCIGKNNYSPWIAAHYADNRILPLALLRLMILLPCLVDIRLRKPWFRARLILLGWNVRFILKIPYLYILAWIFAQSIPATLQLISQTEWVKHKKYFLSITNIRNCRIASSKHIYISGAT
jgi:hypothetical protein